MHVSPIIALTPCLSLCVYVNQNCNFQSSVGSPFSRLNPQIIGAEDDYFDTEQEQVLLDNCLSVCLIG